MPKGTPEDTLVVRWGKLLEFFSIEREGYAVSIEMKKKNIYKKFISHQQVLLRMWLHLQQIFRMPATEGRCLRSTRGNH